MSSSDVRNDGGVSCRGLLTPFCNGCIPSLICSKYAGQIRANRVASYSYKLFYLTRVKPKQWCDGATVKVTDTAAAASDCFFPLGRNHG